MKHQLFLTSMDKQWETNRKPVFLGDWCLRYSDYFFWENHDYEIVPDIWKKDQLQKEMSPYCLSLIDRFAESLYKMLNHFHQEDHSVKYWRFILLDWLYVYIFEWYSRYKEITNALYRYSDLKINLLGAEDIDQWFGFGKELTEDEKYGSELYYWSIYSRIIRSIKKKPDIELEEIHYNRPEQKEFNTISDISTLKKFKSVLKKLYLRGLKESPIICFDFYGGDEARKIRRQNIGHVLFADMPHPKLSAPCSPENRKNLKLEFQPQNEFEHIIAENILYDIPQYALENYKELVDFRKRNLFENPRTVILAGSIIRGYCGVLFADWYEKQVEFLLTAHSPMSAIVKKHYLESVFLLECKKYSWGSCDDPRNLVCPSFKSYEFKNSKKEIKESVNTQILWCGSGIGVQSIMRRPWTLWYSSEIQRKEALNNYILCLKNINADLHKYLLYRPRDVSFGMVEFFERYIPNLNIDEATNEAKYSMSVSVRKSLQERFNESRMVICESLLTSVFYEALNANVPVIVIEKDIYVAVHEDILYSDVLYFFEELKENKMWFESGQEAADFINKNYDNINKWWMSKKIQNIREKFLNRFFLGTDNVSNWWKKEFSRILLEKEL